MNRHVRTVATLLPIISLTLLLAGCPKRPAMTAATAPPPVPPAAVAPPTPAAPAPAPAPAPAGAPPTAAPAPAPAPTGSVNEYPGQGRSGTSSSTSTRRTSAPDAQTLAANAPYLKANQPARADRRPLRRAGDAEYNLALGERRAKSAMNYLVSNGVEAARITTHLLRQGASLCTEKTEACWAMNRNDTFLTKDR